MARSPARATATGLCAVLTTLVLSACGLVGGGGVGGQATSRPPAASPGTLTPPRGTILSANSTAQLGTVVIDGLGRTLYRFDKDSASPSTATCVDSCASTWPPVLDEPGTPVTVEGIDRAIVGTVARPDGSVQVTIGGWPVYRYAADPAPGATTGHGVGGTWFAVTPDGGRAAPP